MNPVHYFQMGGWVMYPLLALGMVGLMAAVLLPALTLFARLPKTWTTLLLGTLGVLSMSLGAIGQELGMQAMNRALAHVPLEMAESIRQVGSSEARVALIFGLMCGLAPLTMAVSTLGAPIGEGTWLTRPRLLSALGGGVAAMGCAALLLAVIGQQVALQQGEAAAGRIEPAMTAMILAESLSSAAFRLQVGLFLGGLPLLVGGALLVVGLRMKPAQP